MVQRFLEPRNTHEKISHARELFQHAECIWYLHAGRKPIRLNSCAERKRNQSRSMPRSAQRCHYKARTCFIVPFSHGRECQMAPGAWSTMSCPENLGSEMTNNGGDWETARNHCLTNGARREIMRYETLKDKPSSLLTWTRARRERGMRSVVNSFTFPLVRGDLNPAPLDPEKSNYPSIRRKYGTIPKILSTKCIKLHNSITAWLQCRLHRIHAFLDGKVYETKTAVSQSTFCRRTDLLPRSPPGVFRFRCTSGQLE